MKNAFHIMIIPTLGCPSRCSYCWSSEEGSPVMTIGTVREIIDWLRDFRSEPVTITFHGGEPLLAGEAFYREALPRLAEGLSHLEPSFALQTNLWRMTPELAEIFAEYRIPIGSSIDGPKEINDLQRSEGYFERTMRGYAIAREKGLQVSFICTFTSRSVRFREEIFDFFLKNGLVMKLHPALPSLRSSEPEGWALDPEEYGELLVFLLDRYLEHLDEIVIMNIDDLLKSVMIRHGTVCTFADCMDSTYAIGPDGSIYPCYRFVGMREYVMGHVSGRPTREELAASVAGRKLQEFKAHVDRACAGCRHIRYCRGGCPYNAIAPTGGEVKGVDPHCRAYKRIYDEITERLDAEMFGGCALAPATSRGGGRKRAGVMSLMRRITMR